MNLVHLFFSTQGRVRRRTYWAIVGLWLLIDILLRGGVSAAARWSGDEQLVAVLFWAWIAFSVIAYFPMTALLVKRLHDIGRSGYWSAFQHGFLASLLLMVTAIVNQSLGTMLIWIVALLVCSLGLLIVFVFTVLPGEDEHNGYGVA